MGTTSTNGRGIGFWEAFQVWMKIGLLSFGGPVGQIAMMHRMLVEERRWISNDRFLHALNYCHLLPGPEAQQLAVYIGWLLHGTRGGIVAGTLFILPGFFVVLTMSFLYAAFRQVPMVEALFYGLKPAVLAVVITALVRIGQKSLKNLYAVFLAASAFLALFLFNVPFPIVVFASAVLGYLGGSFCPTYFKDDCPGWMYDSTGKPTPSDGQAGAVDSILDEGSSDHTQTGWVRSLKVAGVWLPLWLGPVVILGLALGWDNVFARMAVFFSKMAVVTFGGAYAVLAYVAQEAVGKYQWLSAGDMLNGLALAETTPGPLILVLQFVGFLAAFKAPGVLSPLLAGTLGAVLTVWVTFTPCYFWIFLGAPYIERVRKVTALKEALSGVTAAVAGVVLNLSIWFGLHALFAQVGAIHLGILNIPYPVWSTIDFVALGLTVLAFGAMKFLKLGMVATLGGCAVLGMIAKLLV